jgi:hypothetical protein
MERYRFFARTATLLTLGLIALATSPAQAQAVGATDVDITIPDIVILHYFSAVDVQITSDALGTYLTGSAGDSSVDEGTAAPAAGGFDQDLNIGPSAVLTGDPTAAVLVLRNAWAVRAISLAGGANTQLAIANTDPTLDHAHRGRGADARPHQCGQRRRLRGRRLHADGDQHLASYEGL